MADPGLAIISTLKEVYLLSRFVARTARSATNHRTERSELEQDLEFEQLYIRSFGLLLRDNHGALVRDTNLNREWLHKITDLLDSLRLACGDYAKLAAQHDREYRELSPFLNSPDPSDLAVFDLPADIEGCGLLDLLKQSSWSTDSDAGAVTKQEPPCSNEQSTSHQSVTTKKRFELRRDFDWRWALFEKKKLKSILKVFQNETNKLKAVLQLTGASNSAYNHSNKWFPPNKSNTYHPYDTVRALGLVPHFQLRCLTHPPRDDVLVAPRLPLQHIQIEEGELNVPPGQGELAIASYDATNGQKRNRPENVIVEFKVMAEDSSPSDEERILELGRLLAASRDSDLCTLPFRCVVRHGFNSSYAFLFSFPPHTQECAPVSLYDLIDPGITTEGILTLPYRFHIAQSISKALAALHADDWVHKSFRSRSIVFFYTHAGQLRLATPYLTSFEYSRATSTNTSWTHDEDAEKNLYRHPDRQRPPPISFNKLHDVWALGVVLLEIGLWETAQNICDNGLAARDHVGTNLDPYLLKDMYLERASKDLPHTMGPAYAKAVETCFKWDFDCGATDPGLALAVYNRVVSRLGAECLSSFGLEGT
jgi:hypothetical protein